MSKVYVFLADGFEEIEGLTVVDLLRRAGEEVETVSIMGRKMIEGSHKIKVEADALFEETDFTEGKMLVLPGGMPGTRHLGAYKPLTDMLRQRQIVIHCEMQIQNVLLCTFIYPINLEPMIWSIRVAVKPKFRTFYRASSSSLVNE